MFFQSMGFQFMDIAKFDDLIEHAQFHNEQYGDSMFVFISKHYGELKAEHQEKHQEEEKEHEKLPFNHSSCAHATHTIAFVLESFRNNILNPDFSESIEANFYYHTHNSTHYNKGLFQPPRFL